MAEQLFDPEHPVVQRVDFHRQILTSGISKYLSYSTVNDSYNTGESPVLPGDLQSPDYTRDAIDWSQRPEWLVAYQLRDRQLRRGILTNLADHGGEIAHYVNEDVSRIAVNNIVLAEGLEYAAQLSVDHPRMNVRIVPQEDLKASDVNATGSLILAKTAPVQGVPITIAWQRDASELIAPGSPEIETMLGKFATLDSVALDIVESREYLLDEASRLRSL